MHFQYIPYIWPLIISGCISLALGIYSLIKQRNTKCASSFILSMFVVTIWSFANALEMSSADFATKLFWANMQYFAYCYSPVSLLVMCMQFTGYDKWIQNKRILWIGVLPTIIFLLVWTNPLHGFIRYDIYLDYSGLFPVIHKKYGFAFYIHAIYSHALNIVAWTLLIRAVFFKNTVYKKQAIALFFGVSLIVLPNVLYIFGFSPIKRFDITPIFFGPAGLIIAWGIFRYRLFDLVPIARATVIETMDAGVMIMDLQNRVLDVNPAFQKIAGISITNISSRRVEEICSKIPKFATACLDRSTNYTEFTINDNEYSKIYEALFTPLTDAKDRLIGKLAVIYEVTEKYQSQQELLKQQWKLAVIEERERMIRDMHDNLGQVLGFLNLQAQGIRQELKNAGIDIASDKLDKLVEVTQSTHNDIRTYIQNIRSSIYLEKDFMTALKKDIMNFEAQTAVPVNLIIPTEFHAEELKPNIRINMLYIIKEALNNINKHAKAKHVTIRFIYSKNQICLKIEDDGKGFDSLKRHKEIKTKFGLDIMQERANEIGGEIHIQSSLKKGCQIQLIVPNEP